jgi:hypothetical protein
VVRGGGDEVKLMPVFCCIFHDLTSSKDSAWSRYTYEYYSLINYHSVFLVHEKYETYKIYCDESDDDKRFRCNGNSKNVMFSLSTGMKKFNILQNHISFLPLLPLLL